MHMLLTVATLGSFGLIQWLIIIMVIAGCVGIVYVVAKQAGVVIPSFVITILWICLAVFVGVVAVKFLASMI